ncbi:hypothetical protein EDB80DRAFT_456844 [Ilyonectria destructans]|nr:hypothetical protein EDB80DRAFT_456844 [Ilyonectria destructans]
MAEVLGIAAASAQFAELGFKLVKFAKAVYDQAQNAPEDIQKWLTEIEQLKELVADVESCPTLQTGSMASILENCAVNCQELCKILEGITFSADQPLHLRTWKGVVGMAKEKDISGLFGQLERAKTMLAVKIGMESLYVLFPTGSWSWQTATLHCLWYSEPQAVSPTWN